MYLQKKLTIVLKLSLFISIILFTGCFSVRSLQVGKISDLKPENITANSITFAFQARIKNQNNFGITVSKVRLNASLDGKELGKVSKINKIKIKRNSDDMHEIKVTVKFKEQSTGISDLFRMYQKRNAMKFKGFIKARAFCIGKKIRIEDKNLFQLLNY